MATLVEYLDESPEKGGHILNPKITPIGYLTLNPKEALKELLPSFSIVNYLDISLPSMANYGLKISSIADGTGLVGTIKILTQNELVKRCRHDPLSKKQKKQIVDDMKLRIKGLSNEPFSCSKAEKYTLIFDILGYPMSIKELIKLSTPKDYYAPILNGKYARQGIN